MNQNESYSATSLGKLYNFKLKGNKKLLAQVLTSSSFAG